MQPVVIGGLLTVFGLLTFGAMVLSILAVTVWGRRARFEVALGGWLILGLHGVGTVVVVEGLSADSGLLPLYLRVIVLTSVVPVIAATLTTAWALFEIHAIGPPRWLTPVLAIMIGGAHFSFALRFCVRHDPYRSLPSAPVMDVKVGTEHGCRLHDDGTVMCWGSNERGQLGDGTGQTVDWPVIVHGVGDAVALAVGDGQSCVRRSRGEIECWGRMVDGSVAAAPRRIDPMSVAGPWLAGTRIFAVDGRGLVTSGRETLGSIVPLPPIAQVAAGLRHVCGRMMDGQVLCWGDGSRGQLGRSVTFDRTTPVDEDDTARLDLSTQTRVMGVDGVIDIVAGDHHTCALREGGRVTCWGARDAGSNACRDGCTAVGPLDVEGLTDAISISAGAKHTCALRAGGQGAVCWGDNRWGQLGNGSYRSDDRPQAVHMDGMVTKIVANGYTSCALRDAGDVWCWGASRSGSLGVAELQPCRARKVLASSHCAPSPQPMRWAHSIQASR